MSTIEFLIFLLPGYIIYKAKSEASQAPQSDGWALPLDAMIHSIIPVVLAQILIKELSNYPSFKLYLDYISNLFPISVNEKFSSLISVSLVISLLCAFAIFYIEPIRNILKGFGTIGQIRTRQGEILVISLKNNKFYIAVLQDVFNTKFKDVLLVTYPISSGYRDKETLQVNIDKSYYDSFDDLYTKFKNNKLTELCIRYDEISSFGVYDKEIHSKFIKEGSTKSIHK